MALGCSSNSVLHLTAIANEAKIPINLDIINEVSATAVTHITSNIIIEKNLLMLFKLLPLISNSST